MKYLIFIAVVLTSTKSIAQKQRPRSTDSTFIMVISPGNKDVIKTRLPYNSKVKFKISNINPFKIEGTNSISKESISFDVPAQFSQLLVEKGDTNSKLEPGEEGDKGKGANNNDSSGKSKSTNQFSDLIPPFSINDKSKRNEDRINALQKQNDTLRKEIETLKKLQQLRDSIYNLKKIFVNNYNDFVSTLNKLSLYTSVDTYIDSLLQETFIIDTATLKSNLDGYMTSINDDDADINLLRGKCRKALEDIDTYYINAKGAYDELAKKIKNEKVVLSDWNSKDKNAEIKINSLKITLVREKIFDKEFQFLTAKYDTINKGNNKTAIINNTNEAIDYYNRVHNSKFEVYTDAQQLNDDKITITPKLKNAKGDIVKEYNPVEIKTYGGLKVDFSTGYLLSFKGDNNYTNLYDSSGIIGVQKNKTDNLKHAIGALLNVYPRTGRDLNFGFSVGISLPTDGTSVGFYGGFSALFLEKNRLVVSFGMAENKVNLLNTGNLTKDITAGKISGKETYKFSNADFKEIKYDNVYRPAFFVGISYNIFTVKK